MPSHVGSVPKDTPYFLRLDPRSFGDGDFDHFQRVTEPRTNFKYLNILIFNEKSQVDLIAQVHRGPTFFDLGIDDFSILL